jgi:hypothetical protein
MAAEWNFEVISNKYNVSIIYTWIIISSQGVKNNYNTIYVTYLQLQITEI